MTYQMFGFTSFSLITFCFAFLDVYLAKSKILWESCLTIRHSVDLLLFRQPIENSSISLLQKKKSTYFHEILIFFVIPSTSPSCNNFKRLMYQRKVEIWCQKSAYTIMRFWAIALNKLYRLIRNGIRKNPLCSEVRPPRSKWRPDLKSAWNSA